MKILSNLDLRQNQLLNAVIENRTSHPEGAIPGQIYFNTQDKVFYGLTESNVWIDISNNFDSSAIEASIEAIQERLAELVGIEDEVAGLESKITSEVEKLTAEDLRIAGLVTAETSRAQGEEAKIREEFVAADTVLKSALEGKITEVSEVANQNKSDISRISGELAQEILDRKAADSAQDLVIANKAEKSYVDGELVKKADAVHTHTADDVSGLGTAAKLNVGTEAGQVPVLDEHGKLNYNVIPSVAINTTEVVETPEAALALNQKSGDIVIININSQQVAAIIEKYNADQANRAKGFQVLSQNVLNEEYSAYLAQGKTTYICVDPLAESFEERYRPLNSIADSMTKAEIEAALSVKADKTQVTLDIDAAKSAAIAEAERLSGAVQSNLDSAKLELEGSISTVDGKVTALTGRVATNESEITSIKQAATALEGKVDGHIDDSVVHITAEERESWNSRTKKVVATIGNGAATSYEVIHNLGSEDVQVTVKEALTGMVVFTDINCSDANKVVISFAKAPTAEQFKVVVIG